jgi:tetratricopeptide (TPR) repeat protein
MKNQVATLTFSEIDVSPVAGRRRGLLALVLLSGLALSITAHADPSALTRPKIRDMIRTQGWDSIENWQQMRDQADNLMSWGMYEEAAKAYEEAGKVLQRQKGAQHPLTLRNRVDHANALMRLGKPEGEKELREVYEMQKKRLQPDHADILLTRHLMALLEEAEKELSHVVSRRALTLGPADEATLASRTNLAYVLSCMYRYADAEEQLRLVLAAEMKNLGPTDLETCATRERLGECYQSQSKFDLALAEYRAVYMVVNKEYGPRHPLTYRAQHNLAYILYRQGKHEQAEQDFSSIAAMLTVMVGPDDPQTLEFRGSKAACLRARGKLADAEKELRAILDICTRSAMKESREMQEWRDDLAKVLMETRKVDEAEQLLNITLDQRRKLLGPSHPLTLDSWHSLVACKASRGNFRAAEEELRSLVQVRAELQGPYHMSTLSEQLFMADLMLMNGRPEKALPIFKYMRDLFERAMGPLHPSTLELKFFVAIAYYEMGKVDESMTVQKQLLKDYEHIMGPEHLATLRVRLQLAGYLKDAGRFSEAERHYVEALVVAEKTLGATHATTIAGLAGYGRLLSMARRPNEAEIVARQGIRSTAAFSETSAEMLQFKELLGLALVQQGRPKEAESVATEIEHLLVRQEGRLSPHVLSMSTMVAWVKLATGRENESAQVLASTMLQLKNMGYDPKGETLLQMRTLEAIILQRQGKKAQLDTALAELAPELKKKFRDGEPIRALPQTIIANKAGTLPVMLHAVEFSRSISEKRLTDPDNVNRDYFPPNTTDQQKKLVYDMFDKGAEFADKKQNAAAYDQYALYLKKVSEIAGEHSMLALGAHLCLAREAVTLRRTGAVKDHSHEIAIIVKKLPKDGGTVVLEYLYRNYAVQAEHGTLLVARNLTEMVVGEMNTVLGPTDLTTLSCSSALADIMLNMDAQDAGSFLKSLVAKSTEELGLEGMYTVNLRLKLMRWHLAKNDFHSAHTLAYQLDLPVRRLYGEYSENSLSVREALAAAMEGQGVRSMAISESKLVLGDYERIFGGEALATVSPRGRLGMMLQRGGQPAEALQLFQTNIKILKFPATEKLPIMVEAQSQAGLALLALGRFAEAKAHLVEGSRIARAFFGDNHPLVEHLKKLLKLLDEVSSRASGLGPGPNSNPGTGTGTVPAPAGSNSGSVLSPPPGTGTN